MGFLNKFYYISIELFKNGQRGKMVVGDVNNQLGNGC